MTVNESLEVTRIYSVAGILSKAGRITERPFRSPHHTVSAAGLIGGGSVPKPGEVTLSHNGVLFLDELPEFSRSVLEVLRQPLEDGDVRIVRARASLAYPASFILIAAMIPVHAVICMIKITFVLVRPEKSENMYVKFQGLYWTALTCMLPLNALYTVNYLHRSGKNPLRLFENVLRRQRTFRRCA